MARHTLNTISGGFADGREKSSARKRYARLKMHLSWNLFLEKEERLVVIEFSGYDSEGVVAYENDQWLYKYRFMTGVSVRCLSTREAQPTYCIGILSKA